MLTLREVQRDEDGKMDDLKEWTWWALEMVRRTLRDWWTRDVWPLPKQERGKGQKRGVGGEGCVLMIDTAGAGYRNLVSYMLIFVSRDIAWETADGQEVELLPTLLSVGHNNFPGVFEAVYVVNAGWTQRSMWKVVKRVLPKSALDKVNFLDSKRDVAEIFDLDRLPMSKLAKLHLLISMASIAHAQYMGATRLLHSILPRQCLSSRDTRISLRIMLHHYLRLQLQPNHRLDPYLVPFLRIPLRMSTIPLATPQIILPPRVDPLVDAKAWSTPSVCA